jgi:bacterioferritin-associated ferredoxin
MDVRRQGAWPSHHVDLLAVARWLPRRWIRNGFERPYWLRSGTKRFELWERLLMNLAGSAIPPTTRTPCPEGRRWDGQLVVVGGGPAGVRAANAAAAAGERVCLVSRSSRLGSYSTALGQPSLVVDPRVMTLLAHEAVGVYRHGSVVLAAPRNPDAPASVLVAAGLFIATGRESIAPLVPGNDLPGVLEARTALRWAEALGPDLGPTVVVGTGDEQVIADALRRCGVDVRSTGSSTEVQEIIGTSSVQAVRIGGNTVPCRSVVHGGPWVSNGSLPFQAGSSGILRLTGADLPGNVRIIGSAADANEPLAVAACGTGSSVSVCACMDVSVEEIAIRINEGERHIEELKRSTSCGMGPCQGFPCWETLRCVVSSLTGEPMTDRPTARPPSRGLTVAQAAGLDGLLEPE